MPWREPRSPSDGKSRPTKRHPPAPPIEDYSRVGKRGERVQSQGVHLTKEWSAEHSGIDVQVCAHLCRRSGRVHVSLEDQSLFQRQQHFSVFLEILHGNDEYFSSYSTCCTHNNSIFQASCEVIRSRSGTPLAIIDGTAAPKPPR